MIRSLWIARTGLDAQQLQIDNIANNLANTATNGYKRSRAIFEDLMYQNLRQSGAQSSQQTSLPTGLQVGTGVRPVATERVFTQGNLQRTDNAFDLAIQGQGFFQVLTPDGSTAYTRDGTFNKDSQGNLVTASGYQLQPNIVVPADALSFSVGRDGIVTVTQPGTTAPTQIGQLQLANFVNPAGLQSVGENLFQETAASGTPTPSTPGQNGVGTVNQSFVETSNVNVAEELVQMIQTQRAYELNSKVVSTSDQMLGRLSQL